MSYRHILAIDPSGAFDEGNGTTGWCIADAQTKKIITTGYIRAEKFPCAQAYWDAHLNVINEQIRRYKHILVVIEDYVLYADKAKAQINSKMETCKLIGVLQHYCYCCKIPFSMQLAAAVKKRWSDKMLQHKGVIVQIGTDWILPGQEYVLNKHVLDSIRHVVHYMTFRNK